MNPNRVTLQTANDPGFNAGANLPVRSGPFVPGSGKRTYSADAKNTANGAKNATVDFYGSNVESPSNADESDWTKIGSVALVTDGVHRKGDGFVSNDTWNTVKSVISAADAEPTLVVNSYVSTSERNA